MDTGECKIQNNNQPVAPRYSHTIATESWRSRLPHCSGGGIFSCNNNNQPAAEATINAMLLAAMYSSKARFLKQQLTKESGNSDSTRSETATQGDGNSVVEQGYWHQQ